MNATNYSYTALVPKYYVNSLLKVYLEHMHHSNLICVVCLVLLLMGNPHSISLYEAKCALGENMF